MKDERDALTEEEKKYFLEYDEMLAEPAFFLQQPRNNGNDLENTPLCDLMDRMVGLDNQGEHFLLRPH